MTNRLRELRSSRRWTQAALAQRLDVSRQTINALERGKHHPSLPLAFRIAEVFDTRIEDVFRLRRFEGREAGREAGATPSREVQNA